MTGVKIPLVDNHHPNQERPIFCYDAAMHHPSDTVWSAWLTKAIEIISLGYLLLLPLIIGPGGATPVAKMVTVNVGGSLLVVAVALRFLERRAWRDQGWWRVNPVEISFFGVTGTVLLATLFAPDRNLSWWGAKHHGLGGLTYLFLLASALIIGRSFVREEFRRRSLWVLLIGLALISLHALSQTLGIDLPVYRSIQAFSFQGGQRERAFATFGNPIHLTIYLMLLIPLLGSWWLTLTNRVHRWVVGAVLLAAGGAVFASLASHSGAQRLIDGAYLTLFGVLGVGLWLLRSPQPRTRRLAQLVTWFVFAAFVISCVIVRWPALLGPISHPLARLIPQSEAFATRYPNWEMARRVAAARPWLGDGLDAYQNQYHQVYSLRLTQFDPQASHIDRAHQIALDWLVTTGWVGWLAFLGLIAVGLRAGWQILDRPDRQSFHWYAAGAIVAILTYLTQVWLNFSSQPDLLILFVLIASLGAIAVQKTTGVEARLRQPAPVQAHFWGVGLILVVGLPVLLWFVGIRFWLADRATQAGIHLIEAQANRPADQQDFGPGLNDLRRAQRLAPVFADSDRILADGLHRAGQFPQALATIESARRRAPANRELLEEEGLIRLDWAAHDPHQADATHHFLDQAFHETKFWTPLWQDELELAAIENNPDRAETIKKQAIAWAPKQFLNWDSELGTVFAKHHHPEIAISSLEASLRRHPRADDAPGWFALGYAQTELHHLPEALVAFQTCTQLNLQYLPCWSGRWSAARELQRTDEVSAILTAMRRFNPTLAEQLQESLAGSPAAASGH